MGALLFETNGGSPIEPLVAPVGSAIEAPEEPERPGYAFGGWYADAELTLVYVFSTMPQGVTTVYVRWSANIYTVTLDRVPSEGGTVSGGGDYFSGATVTLTATTNEGYTFVGWYGDEGTLSSSTPTHVFTMPSQSVEFTAVWEPKEITLTFDTQGGSEIDPYVEPAGTTIQAPADPTRVNYAFIGWYADENLTVPFAFSKMPNEDTTIYAGWFDGTLIRVPGDLELIRYNLYGNYLLMNDLDLQGAEWIPLGLSLENSAGFTLNGNGHKISNFVLTTTRNYVGFIGYGNECTVVNLTLDEVVINIQGASTLYVGPLMGFGNAVSLFNVQVIASLTAGGSGPIYAGGLVGMLNSGNCDLVDLWASTDVETNTSGFTASGGLVGFVNGADLYSSAAYGDVTATGYNVYAGGLIGHISQGNLERAYSRGNVKATAINIAISGGIAGRAGTVYNVIDCYETGNVSAKMIGPWSDGSYAMAGGIFGTFYEGVLTNCLVLGDVEAVVNFEDVACSAGWVYGSPSDSASATNCFHNELAQISGNTMILNGTTVAENQYLSTEWIRGTLKFTDLDWIVIDGSLPELEMDPVW
jgi:uncharacterized repeat protein (TIGR02543 family)